MVGPVPSLDWVYGSFISNEARRSGRLCSGRANPRQRRTDITVTRPKARVWTVVKVLASVALVCGAAVYLLGGSLRGSIVYDKTVDELMEELEDLAGPVRVRLGGRLVSGSHQIREGTSDHDFTLRGERETVQVRYTGLWPDAATDDRELMVEGTVGQDGVIDAERVLARCPSRYKKRVSVEASNGSTP